MHAQSSMHAQNWTSGRQTVNSQCPPKPFTLHYHDDTHCSPTPDHEAILGLLQVPEI